MREKSNKHPACRMGGGGGLVGGGSLGFCVREGLREEDGEEGREGDGRQHGERGVRLSEERPRQ